MDGGYDTGYRACPCFWGRTPGSLVLLLEEIVGNFNGLNILDLGCGEGKNAFYLAARGGTVRAIELSEFALFNARNTWGSQMGLTWEKADARSVALDQEVYDVVIAYGLFHCLSSESEISKAVARIRRTTKRGGYNIVCAFNSRSQDLRAHPNFHPCLLDHSVYLQKYSDWQIVHGSDSDLTESHPHNNIVHKHSMTRLVVRKP